MLLREKLFDPYTTEECFFSHKETKNQLSCLNLLFRYVTLGQFNKLGKIVSTRDGLLWRGLGTVVDSFAVPLDFLKE